MALQNPQTVRTVKPALGFVEFVSLMAVLTSLVALSIDAMLPALDHIGMRLGSSSAQESYLIVTLFFLGMAIGQLCFGPISDAYGRRTTILSGLVIFAAGSLICLFATSMPMLLVGRVVQAIGVSGPRIATMALIRDQYAGNDMARVMSFIMMIFILVPMLAPAFGQVILFLFDWRHIFTAFFVIAMMVGTWFFIRQPETLCPENQRPLQFSRLFRACVFIFSHRMVMGYTLAMGCIFGTFLAYLSASQTLFVTIYQVGEAFPLYFALLAFAIGFASFVNAKLVMRWGMMRLCSIALLGMICGSGLLVLWSVIWAGVPPLWVLVTTLLVIFFFVGILFGNLNSMAMYPLGKMAGLGAAIIGSLSSLLSVPIAILINQFMEGSILPLALGFLTFGTLTALFVWWAGNPQVLNQ